MSKLDAFDLTIPPFPAPFRKWLMSNGIVSYKLKCLGFAPSMYVIAVLLSIATNTFPKLVTDHGAQLVVIVATVTFYGLVHGCKQIGSTINNLDKTTVHSKYAKFKDFIDWITSENSWCHIRNRYWYYIRTLGLAAIFVGLKYFIYEPGRWTIGADQNAIWINDFYNTFCWAMVGYVIGLGLELALIYTFSIYRYCKEFLKAEKIKLLPVEELGGLKPLGNLALRINIACAIPSIYVLYVLYHFYSMWTEERSVTSQPLSLLNEPWSLLMLIIYVLILAFVFLKPLAPAHKVLAGAKKRAIEQSSRQIRQAYDRVMSGNTAKSNLLCSLLSNHQSIRKARTWPLDMPLSIVSTATILFPVIGGALLQVLFGYLFNLLGK